MRRNVLALAAMAMSVASMAGFAEAASVQMPAPRTRVVPRSSGGSINGSTNGAGWSTEQVKRMAKKRRNVQRNRRAHRRSAA